MEFNEEIMAIVEKVRGSIVVPYKLVLRTVEERGVFLLYIEYLEWVLKDQELFDKYQDKMMELINYDI